MYTTFTIQKVRLEAKWMKISRNDTDVNWKTKTKTIRLNSKLKSPKQQKRMNERTTTTIQNWTKRILFCDSCTRSNAIHHAQNFYCNILSIFCVRFHSIFSFCCSGVFNNCNFHIVSIKSENTNTLTGTHIEFEDAWNKNNDEITKHTHIKMEKSNDSRTHHKIPFHRYGITIITMIE